MSKKYTNRKVFHRERHTGKFKRRNVSSGHGRSSMKRVVGVELCAECGSDKTAVKAYRDEIKCYNCGVIDKWSDRNE